MIKYLAASKKIVIVEVVGETDRFVKLINGRKESKMAERRIYCNTFDDAKNFLVDNAQKKVYSLRLQLERAKGELGQIKGIKEPN